MAAPDPASYRRQRPMIREPSCLIPAAPVLDWFSELLRSARGLVREGRGHTDDKIRRAALLARDRGTYQHGCGKALAEAVARFNGQGVAV